MVKRALIFDFGGVLMKTADYRPRHRWDERLNLPHGSVERVVHNTTSWVQAQTGRVTPSAYWRDVGGQLGLSADETQQLAVDFYSGDALDEALIALIRGYQGAGHTVALLSNDSLELLPKLARLGIDGLFDPLIVSAQVGLMKPDPAIYAHVLGVLQRPPGHTIFVDDRAENVAAAARLGIHTIHYHAGMDLAAALSPLLVMGAAEG
ncbi:HAD family phosphatase [bacterium]|nr:HAD family phosphatase [bacterium]